MAKYGVTEQDAFAMCRQEGLLSPLYEHSHRGGCWFCPNASMTELRHLYRAHRLVAADAGIAGHTK